jgi:group II intron reverse transcriptase/maturase
LRRTGEHQLSFAFADSPQGGGRAESSGGPEGKAWLLLRANGKEAGDPVTQVGDTSRLLERAASVPNLARALLKVARNRGAAGVDGSSVDEVVEVSRRLLPKLRHELLSGGYRPGDVRRVWIPKPGGGQRGLGIPNVVDRWVQESVREVLEPIFEPTFHGSSHGFRPQRGAQTAIAEAKRYVEQGYDIVIDLDLSRFFDRVNHQRLLNRLGQRVADGRVLKLVHRMLKAKVVMPDGTRVSTEEGTPQGGPLSPLLSNIVLDELDWELERRGLRFVRYADDVNVYVRSERAGHRGLESIRRFIEGRLRLKVNEEKTTVDRPGNLHFLGFRLTRNREGRVEVHLSGRSMRRVLCRFRELTPRTWGQSLQACFERANRYLRGWIAYFRICTEKGARHFQHFDAHLRRRLRMIILRQKGRRARYLYRHLLARGVSKGAAKQAAYCRRGPWNRSNRPGLTRAYPNAWFGERLASLWSAWLRLNPPERVSGRQLKLFA